MRNDHLWNRVKGYNIQTGPEITGGFSVGFDSKVPEETKDALMDFIYWVEDNFSLPVTLWVDFKDKHYLLKPGDGRVGYKFYWADFVTYPVFENWDDIPVIELATRTENRPIGEILRSFVEAISCYYAWLANSEITKPDSMETDAILNAYYSVHFR